MRGVCGLVTCGFGGSCGWWLLVAFDLVVIWWLWGVFDLAIFVYMV